LTGGVFYCAGGLSRNNREALFLSSNGDQTCIQAPLELVPPQAGGYRFVASNAYQTCIHAPLELVPPQAGGYRFVANNAYQTCIVPHRGYSFVEMNVDKFICPVGATLYIFYLISGQRGARPGYKIFTIQMNLVEYVDGHRV